MMKLKNNFVALDLRYLEKENTGLARYSLNISKYLIKKKENKKLKFIVILPPEKFCIHLKDYIKEIKNNSEIIYWDQLLVNYKLFSPHSPNDIHQKL